MSVSHRFLITVVVLLVSFPVAVAATSDPFQDLPFAREFAYEIHLVDRANHSTEQVLSPSGDSFFGWGSAPGNFAFLPAYGNKFFIFEIGSGKTLMRGFIPGTESLLFGHTEVDLNFLEYYLFEVEPAGITWAIKHGDDYLQMATDEGRAIFGSWHKNTVAHIFFAGGQKLTLPSQPVVANPCPSPLNSYHRPTDTTEPVVIDSTLVPFQLVHDPRALDGTAYGVNGEFALQPYYLVERLTHFVLPPGPDYFKANYNSPTPLEHAVSTSIGVTKSQSHSMTQTMGVSLTYGIEVSDEILGMGAKESLSFQLSYQLSMTTSSSVSYSKQTTVTDTYHIPAHTTAAFFIAQDYIRIYGPNRRQIGGDIGPLNAGDIVPDFYPKDPKAPKCTATIDDRGN